MCSYDYFCLEALSSFSFIFNYSVHPFPFPLPKIFFFFFFFFYIRPTLMHTKNLYENGPNPFFFFGTKNMSEGHLMHTVLVCYIFDKLGQACLCG